MILLSLRARRPVACEASRAERNPLVTSGVSDANPISPVATANNNPLAGSGTEVVAKPTEKLLFNSVVLLEKTVND